MIDNVLILGGRGFLGRRITAELEKYGVDIFLYNRSDDTVCSTTESNSISFEEFLTRNEYILAINLLAAWGTKLDPNFLRVANYEFPMKLLDKMISTRRSINWIQISSYFYFYYTETSIDKDQYSYWKRIVSEELQFKCEKIQNNLNVLELYLPHLYGKNDKPNRLFEQLTQQSSETSILNLSSGRQVLPILHVDDCARGIIEILLKEKYTTKYKSLYLREQSQMLLSEIIQVFQSFQPIKVKFYALPDRQNEFYDRINPRIEHYNIDKPIELQQYLRSIFEQETNA